MAVLPRANCTGVFPEPGQDLTGEAEVTLIRAAKPFTRARREPQGIDVALVPNVVSARIELQQHDPVEPYACSRHEGIEEGRPPARTQIGNPNAGVQEVGPGL